MKLKFYKFQATGNDFILLDNLMKRTFLNRLQVIKLCDRRFGIGADGILFLLRPKNPKADFRMRILNADGTEAEMCGNGIRALAKYIYLTGLSREKTLWIETLAGLIKIEKKANLYRVAIGKPNFSPEKIPVKSTNPVIKKKIKVLGQELRISCLSVGNPHCIIFVKELDTIPIKELGPKIEHHRLFPNRTNVEFVQMLAPNQLKVRVWERGAGETLACGTGACASLACAHYLGLAEPQADVLLPGGNLTVELRDDICYLLGPAELVYTGEFEPEKFK